MATKKKATEKKEIAPNETWNIPADAEIITINPIFDDIAAMSEKELRTFAQKVRPHSTALFDYVIELAREKKA